MASSEQPDSCQVTMRVHTQLPADHPFYVLVGRVASEWAHLEHLLDLIIWHLAGIPDAQGACMTAQIMGVGPRCKAIISLGKLQAIPDPFLKNFRKLMSDSYNVADERARVVHDPWYMDKADGTPGQFRSMPYSNPAYGIEDVTAQQVEDIIVRIRGLRDRVGHLRNAVLAKDWS